MTARMKTAVVVLFLLVTVPAYGLLTWAAMQMLR